MFSNPAVFSPLRFGESAPSVQMGEFGGFGRQWQQGDGAMDADGQEAFGSATREFQYGDSCRFETQAQG
ncbi:hypothetical protein [Acidovorax sp. NCPPB 3576]|uniref:hypothetical protein n=1 Tax=Acidovorax sp. NCPPB 3576 TaxID=2940488 RepID=UPI002349F507|nr:hypothetical protein [Acidovorax sp. NCPPB 3576]WCM89962.1 hypothetical protein M5C98_08040 [Acidovorax sp. NCPPB 3576]